VSDNALVTPPVFTLPRAIDARAQDETMLGTRGLPCTVTKIVGEMVTVKFEVASKFTMPQVTIPQAYSAWIRSPTQVGDRGVALPLDYYLGGQSQLGGGTANLFRRANLTPLIFHPISQVAFPTNPSRNLNAVMINGPQGVVIQDTGNHCSIVLTATTITITDSYGNEVLMTANGPYVKPGTGLLVYLGGDQSDSYDFVVTLSGPSTKVKAII
jgi:hypothetical protein